MKCYVCGSKLIWGGDHDSESGDFAIETNLSCPDCNAFVLVSWGKRWVRCEHNEIRYATSADWQDVCVDCGAVLKDYSEGESDESKSLGADER